MLIHTDYQEIVLPQKDELLIFSGETTFLEEFSDEFIFFMDSGSSEVEAEEIHFIDGAMRVLHLGPLRGKDGILRPILGGHIGAVRLCLKNHHLEREEFKLQRVLVLPREINGSSANFTFKTYGIEEKKLNHDYESNKLKLYNFITEEMKKMELSLANCNSELIILDGLLNKDLVGSKNQTILGVIKTLKEIYLDSTKHNQLITIKEGFRSPVFLISTSDFPRASWYLRLNGDYTSGYEGIIRIEIPLELFNKFGIIFINRMSKFLFNIRYLLKDYFRQPSILLPILEAERHLYSLFDSPLGLHYFFKNKLKEVGIESFR